MILQCDVGDDILNVARNDVKPIFFFFKTCQTENEWIKIDK